MELVDNARTDKDTIHSYLETYEDLFKNKKLTSSAVMEIGIYDGGSIKLWYDYFPNANIYGIDISRYEEKLNYLNNALDSPEYLLNLFFDEIFLYGVFPFSHLIKNVQYFVQNYLLRDILLSNF